MNQTQTSNQLKPSRKRSVLPRSKELQEAAPGVIMLEKTTFDPVMEILNPEQVYVEQKQPVRSKTKPTPKKQAATDPKSEVFSLKFGLFALQVVNPGKKTIQILLLSMGFILLLVALGFVLRRFL